MSTPMQILRLARQSPQLTVGYKHKSAPGSWRPDGEGTDYPVIQTCVNLGWLRPMSTYRDGDQGYHSMYELTDKGATVIDIFEKEPRRGRFMTMFLDAKQWVMERYHGVGR